MTAPSELPLFYFHVRNGFGFAEDREGARLAGLTEAREYAIKSARSLISADAESGCLDLTGEIQVADESTRVILVVKFSDAIEVVTDASPSKGL